MQGYILQPTKEQGGFYWKDLEVRPSEIQGAGMGVFATKDLRIGASIPIVGRKRYGQPGEMDSHSWLYTGSLKNAWVDGSPHLFPHRHVGCRGLSIAMMINESSEPNCVFRMNYVMVGKPIAAGEELYLYYGKSYDRLRNAHNYSVHRPRGINELLDAVSKVEMPKSKERCEIINSLNFQILNCE